jgi:hypothetical protein
VTISDHDPHAVPARERRLIERVLDVLSGICGDARRTKGLNAPDATHVRRGP